MNGKHGLSQYRLNQAKGYTQYFAESVNKIEMMFQLSVQGLIDEEIAEMYITKSIEELDRNWSYFKDYIEQREIKKENNE